MTQSEIQYQFIQLAASIIISSYRSCAIPDYENEEIIITGGYGALEIMTQVSAYNEAGWQRDLTPLNQGRHQHACGSYVNGGKKVNYLLLYH